MDADPGSRAPNGLSAGWAQPDPPGSSNRDGASCSTFGHRPTVPGRRRALRACPGRCRGPSSRRAGGVAGTWAALVPISPDLSWIFRALAVQRHNDPDLRDRVHVSPCRPRRGRSCTGRIRLWCAEGRGEDRRRADRITADDVPFPGIWRNGSEIHSAPDAQRLHQLLLSRRVIGAARQSAVAEGLTSA